MKNVKTNVIKISVFTNSLARLLNLAVTSPEENARKPKCNIDTTHSLGEHSVSTCQNSECVHL